MKNIYVGNLELTTSEGKLRKLFQVYGTVDAVTLVKDRDTARSRGFAFLEMPDDGEAEAAIRALDGSLLGQQQLRINEARTKHEDLAGKAAVEQRKRPRETLATRTHRNHRF